MSKKIVDISHHQGTIDFSKAKTELDLAVIRVQYGSKKIDTRYKEYVAGCKAHGIPFGHYAYTRYVSVADAIVEAKDFMARADKDAKFLVADVEEMTLKNPKDIIPATQAFIDTCKAGGWKVGLYTGHSFYKQYGMSKVKADFLWIPRYVTNCDGTPHNNKPDMACDLWQFTEKGKLAGVKTTVDLNVLNGIFAIEWFTGEVKNVVSTPTNKTMYTLPSGVLKKGAKGTAVKQLQNALNAANFKCGKVDGIFGESTKDALRRFQLVHLPYDVDGIYGPKTRAKLAEVLK